MDTKEIRAMLDKLDEKEKDFILEALLKPQDPMKPCMTISDFSKVSGIPEKRIRQAVKGQYSSKICVGGKENCTAFIKTASFMKLWEEGRLC